MKINSLTTTVMFILAIGCSQKMPEPIELANSIGKEYEKHSSITYDIDYQIKFFSETTDTNKVKAKIDLIRQEEDSVFGGYVWIEEDSTARYYDGDFGYYIDHRLKKVKRFPKDKPYMIKGNIRSEAIRVYFLNPGRFMNGAKDSTIVKVIKEEQLGSDNVYKWTYTFPDDEEYTKVSKDIWIQKNNLSVLKMTYTSTYQNENQYNQWDIKNVLYDSIKKEALAERLEKLLETYDMVDYQEMTAEEREPLKNGTQFPKLTGALHPSNDSSSIKKLQGKVTIVDFWYMNCPPCIEAIPHLNDLFKKYSEKDLVVIGANPFDNNEKSLTRLPNFLENNPISYPILFVDQTKMRDFKVIGYPTFYMLNEQGEIIYSMVGFGEEMPTAVDSLIKVELKIP